MHPSLTPNLLYEDKEYGKKTMGKLGKMASKLLHGSLIRASVACRAESSGSGCELPHVGVGSPLHH